MQVFSKTIKSSQKKKPTKFAIDLRSPEEIEEDLKNELDTECWVLFKWQVTRMIFKVVTCEARRRSSRTSRMNWRQSADPEYFFPPSKNTKTTPSAHPEYFLKLLKHQNNPQLWSKQSVNYFLSRFIILQFANTVNLTLYLYFKKMEKLTLADADAE